MNLNILFYIHIKKMLALGAYKETISSDPNYSLFGLNKEDIQYTEGESKFCVSFDTLVKSTEQAQGKPQESKRKDIPRMDMLNPPSPGIVQTIKSNFLRVGYLALSVGVFIGIGNFSKKYC